jgi:hypothetical protein
MASSSEELLNQINCLIIFLLISLNSLFVLKLHQTFKQLSKVKPEILIRILSKAGILTWRNILELGSQNPFS